MFYHLCTCNVSESIYDQSSVSRLSIFFDPVEKVSELCVDAGVLWVPAADPPRDDAALHRRRRRQPEDLLLADEGSARVALAGVPAALAGAEAYLRDDVSVVDVGLLRL